MKETLKKYKWNIAALVAFIAINIVGSEAMVEGTLIADTFRAIGGTGIILTLFVTALKSVGVKK